ncbi:MAG: OadG family protein [Defluviitaleaceae bacterium]|nr:OadG family protein [Defluviitaleaceae bacterium]
MLSGQEISFAQSVIISLTGMTIVFVELVLLALIIIVFSKVIRRFSREAVQQKPVPAAVPAVNTAAEADEEIAVIIGAISEESGLPLEELQIVSINRI